MGFNRREIRVKATNISVMNRKGGKSILGCRVMSGTITATESAHSHLDGSGKGKVKALKLVLQNESYQEILSELGLTETVRHTITFIFCFF